MKELFDEYMEDVSGGALVVDDERHEYWLVRRDGSVIAPVPMEKGAEFAKAFGTSDEVMTKDEYRRKFGRELKW